MFFGHNNITRTNSFLWGIMSYGFQRLKKHTYKEVEKIVVWPLHESILFIEKHCFTSHNRQV
jgi:hypothetical protein